MTDSSATFPGEARSYALDQAGLLLRRFAFQVSRTSKQATEESVHDLRVAVRRLSESVRAFDSLFCDRKPGKIRKQSKAFLGPAAEVRNRDIALKLFRKARIAQGSKAMAALARQRAEHADSLVEILAEFKETNFARKWRRTLDRACNKQSNSASQTIQEFAASMMPRLVGRYFARGRKTAQGEFSYKALHKFRLRSKRFRYTLELFVPAYGAPAEACLEPMRKLQNFLGSISDCLTTGELAAAVLNENSVEFKRVERFLKNTAQKEFEEFRAYWKEEFDSPGREAQWSALFAAPRVATAAAAGATSDGSGTQLSKNPKP